MSDMNFRNIRDEGIIKVVDAVERANLLVADGTVVIQLDTAELYSWYEVTQTWVNVGGGISGPAFGIIQTDTGTTPTAMAATDTLTLTTNNTSIAEFNGNAITDTVSLQFKYTPENVTNKDNGSLSTSTTTYPTSNAVKSYVDTGLSGKGPTLTKGNLTEVTSSVLTITGGTNSVIGSGTSIQASQASGSTNGYLSSADWTTFNNKQNALGFTPENVSNKSTDTSLAIS